MSLEAAHGWFTFEQTKQRRLLSCNKGKVKALPHGANDAQLAPFAQICYLFEAVSPI